MTQRISMWDRRPGPLGPFKLTPRDKEWIKWVYRCRFVTPSLLWALTGGDQLRVVKRCRQLFDHGYLDRPREQQRSRALTEQICYGLGREGARYLMREDPHYREKLAGRKIRAKDMAERPNRTWSWRTVEHQLLAAKVMICVFLACKKAGYKLRWRGHPKVGHFKIEPHEAPARWPDEFFSIIVPWLPKGKNTVHCFLEADRKVEPSHIGPRAHAYYLWWLERQEDVKWGEWRSWARFADFYVLSVAVDAHRMELAQHASHNVGKDTHAKGWPRLLFTNESLINLDDPLSVLRPIFFRQKPKTRPQDEPLSLIPPSVSAATPALIDEKFNPALGFSGGDDESPQPALHLVPRGQDLAHK